MGAAPDSGVCEKLAASALQGPGGKLPGAPSPRYARYVLAAARVGVGIGGWTPAFLMRVHGASSGEVGTIVGLTSAVAGFVGVTLGGALADRLRRRSRSGRLHVGLLTAALPVLPAL